VHLNHFRRRILPPVSVVLSVAIAASTIAACGAKAKSDGSASTGGRIDASSSPHVIKNPTAAQAFIYLPMTVERESNGDLLILDAGNYDRTNAKVVEMNPQGKPIWLYEGGMDFPHSAYTVGKKDILVSDTNNDRVFMINRKGKMIWNTDNLGGGKGKLGKGRFSNGGQLLYPNDAVMMPHNQVLISSRMNSTVYQVTEKGKVTWECNKFMYRQHRPRFVDGNLWVPDSDNGRVIIINHKCSKVLFDYGPTKKPGQIIWPRSFNPYPGGDYLIGDSQNNRIIVINKKKKIVKGLGVKNISSPYYVDVEKNGDILTTDAGIHGAIEYSKKGKILHEWPTSDPNSYPTTVQDPSFESSSLSPWIRGDMLSETLPAGQRPDMGISTSVAHTGHNSAYINWPKNTSHLYLFFQQTLDVTPGKTYTFTGWVKTKKVKTCDGCDHGKGTKPFGAAAYYIDYVKAGDPNPPPSGVGLGYSSGTEDWEEEAASFTVPSGVTEVQIQAILYGRGEVWFDDASLTQE
jgi:hypothetical protein